MQIRSLTVGPIATCCYILSREDRPDCLVIDVEWPPQSPASARTGWPCGAAGR